MSHSMVRHGALGVSVAIISAALLACASSARANWSGEPVSHNSAFVTSDANLVWDYDLAGWLNTYVPDYEYMPVTLGQSFSGGFIDDLQGTGRSVATSSDWYLPAHYSLTPVDRGTRWLRFWDDSAASAPSPTLDQAYNYATAQSPFSYIDQPQYYSDTGVGNTFKLGQASGENYAILFTGPAANAFQEAMFRAELEFTYSTLVNTYGYAPENIQVLYQPRTGTAPSFVDAPASKASLQSAIQGLGSQMNTTDSLFVWVDSHGVDRFSNSFVPDPNTPNSSEIRWGGHLRLQLVDVNFAQGGGMTKQVSTYAKASTCDGAMETDSSGQSLAMQWTRGGTPVINSGTSSFAYQSNPACGCFAVAMADSNTFAVQGDGLFAVFQDASVYALAVAGTNRSGPVGARAEVNEQLNYTDWIAGSALVLNIDLDLGGKMMLGRDINNKIRWVGHADVAGLEDLWDLQIIGADTLTIDFWSNAALNLDDAAIEQSIWDLMVIDGAMAWAKETISIEFIMIMNQVNFTITTSLVADAAAECVPEPSCVALLAVGGLLTLRRRNC